MCTGDQIKLLSPVTAFLSLLVTASHSVYADETAAYKLTNIDSYFGLRFRYDSNLTKQVVGSENKETRSSFDKELHVQTQGHIYHPNFLKVDMGAGVVLSQENLETQAGTAEDDNTLIDFNTRLLFLEKKPYPLTLYYHKSHPSVALNLTDVFIQKNEKYGMNFSLRKIISPITFNFETYRESNEGNSFTQITDDTNTYQSVRAYTSMGNGGYTQVSYTKNHQESMSGSTSLAIQPFNVTTKTTDLNSHFIFGQKKNIKFNLIAINTSQEQDREREELRFSPSLIWEHNKNFNSYYRYSLTDRQQSSIDTRNTSGEAGMRYQWDENLYSNAEIHYDDKRTSGLEFNSSGASGSVTYKHPLDFGSVQFNIGLNYNDYNRVAPSVVQVIDASYTLVGTTPVTLGHDYIDAATIVVKREDTNEVLTEGLGNDYIVVVIAKQTQIQKVNPALPSSLNVLVSYQYNPGGTIAYDSLGQNYHVSLEVHKYFSIYFNYRDSQQSLKSGLPTLPLESSDTTLYGFRVDYPLPVDMELSVGGEMLNEKHNENISSYEKNSSEVFMQVALPLSSNMYLSIRNLNIDNLYSVEDVNLTRYALRLKSNPARQLSLSLQLSDEKDTGGSLSRRTRNMTFSGQWRIRKLLIKMGARRVLETQGSIKHERTIFNIKLRRDF